MISVINNQVSPLNSFFILESFILHKYTTKDYLISKKVARLPRNFSE
jgi:hypothetical protein